MTDVLTEANNIISEEFPNITISKEEYDILQFMAKMLSALKDAGVHEWEGFTEACKDLYV